jgi:hypothetical protein
MEEERLTHLLRGLPREAAQAGFTAQVLRRLDEGAQPAAGQRRRALEPRHWHRLMLTTATVGALSLSVVVSVGLLQPERPPGAPPAARAQTAGTVSALERQSVPGSLGPLGPLGPLGSPPAPPLHTLRQGTAEAGLAGTPGAVMARPAASRPGAALAIDPARAHQLLREMQLESQLIGRELRRLRRLGGAAQPGVVYLGGDESVDLVLSTGKARAQGPPLAERDGGENFEFLD